MRRNIQPRTAGANESHRSSVEDRNGQFGVMARPTFVDQGGKLVFEGTGDNQ